MLLPPTLPVSSKWVGPPLGILPLFITSLPPWVHPLLLRLAKAALLENRIHSQASSSERASALVVKEFTWR